MKKKHERRLILKSKKRFLIFLFILSMAGCSLFAVTNAYCHKQVTFKEIVVRRGDTLWDISKRYSSASDYRPFIWKLKKINNLSDSGISEGTILKIPVE